MLKSGGLLLIKFPVSIKAQKFEPHQQTNLLLADSLEVFKDNNISGYFDDVVNEF